ncbi:MAG: PH domain-containing protein [Candidatus Doudnabacteria bacterium]|jgi:hypothetical protein
MPKKYFPSQLETETVYLMVRGHWMSLFLKVLVWVFFAAALVLFNRFAASYLPAIFEGSWGDITTLGIQVYTLFLTLALFLIFIFYYLNVQIITDIRIVDITQVGLFSHTISELHIDKIEDATSNTKGILGTIFNYGDVYIQTAGTVDRFEFESVPDPAGIEKLILDLYEKNSNFAKEGKEIKP